jgi:hypothetical protein
VLISKDPGPFRLRVHAGAALSYETLVCDRPVDLQHLASSTGVDLDDIQALNPELRLLVTPGSRRAMS